MGVFVGPYAEFVVGGDGSAAPAENADDRHEEGLELCCCVQPLDPVAPARAGEQALFRHVFWNRGSTEHATAWDDGRVTDLTAVMPADEVRWFASHYAVALESLARHYTVRPRICWGVVCYDHNQYSVFFKAD